MPIYVATTGEGKPSLISEGIFDKVIISGLGLYATGADQYVSVSSGVCVNEKNVHTVSATKVAAQNTGAAYTGYVVVDSDGNVKHTATPDSTDLPIGQTSVDATGVVTAVTEVNRGTTFVKSNTGIVVGKTSTENTSYGTGAGTLGSYNCVFGYYAGSGLDLGTSNVFVGWEAGYNIDNASNNIFIGYKAGYGTVSTLGFGNDNVFIGYGAGSNIESGNSNVGLGSLALSTITTGYCNVAIGNESQTHLTSGYNNVCVGMSSGFSLTTGYNNVCMGVDAGYSLTTGYENVFIGLKAGYPITTGAGNVIIGYASASNSAYTALNLCNSVIINGSSTCGSSGIVAVGKSAGGLGGGVNSILLGMYAGAQCNYGNIYIGYKTGYYSLGKSGNIMIGQTYLVNPPGNNNLIIETQFSFIGNGDYLLKGNFLDRYLHIGGAFGQHISNITAGTAATTYTMTGGEGICLADASTADLTIVLPSSPYPGISYPIKRVDTSTTTTLTIQPASTAQTIDGAASITLAAGDKVKLTFDGSNWHTII